MQFKFDMLGSGSMDRVPGELTDHSWRALLSATNCELRRIVQESCWTLLCRSPDSHRSQLTPVSLALRSTVFFETETVYAGL